MRATPRDAPRLTPTSGPSTRCDTDMAPASEWADRSVTGQRVRKTTSLRGDGPIRNKGTKARPAWVLGDPIL
ncbi:MAG: hypothetical protein LBK95_09640 [Bifidobacteriaceae bacterium]|nr:hypothetical protein [Bifidobacteriaceae bacterium]